MMREHPDHAAARQMVDLDEQRDAEDQLEREQRHAPAEVELSDLKVHPIGAQPGCCASARERSEHSGPTGREREVIPFATDQQLAERLRRVAAELAAIALILDPGGEQ